MKLRKGINPTGKTVEIIAAAIVTIIIVQAVTMLIGQIGDATGGCGPLNQWIADSFNVETC